jgi:HlyD family type I secretion membrane fusion protein
MSSGMKTVKDALLGGIDRLNSWVVGTPRPDIGDETAPPAAADVRRPIRKGLAIILVCVVGLGLWASLAPIWSAVVAGGAVAVEANRKVLRSRDGGIVREIHVREGDQVAAGELLLRFDDTVAQAQVDVLSQQYDNILMQQARFRAEVSGARSVATPAELTERMADPRVSQIVNNELLLFNSRLATLDNQTAILNQRLEQLATARGGLDVQVRAIDEQVALITRELDGYRELNARGFAPGNLLLRYERQLAEIGGRRGALVADITRNTQQAGEVRLQLNQLREQRQTEAATGLRDSEARLADLSPRLDAARSALAQTRVTAPEAGYVLNLTQFTLGGVVQPGELLMDVVPLGAELIVQAQVQPRDIDEVRPGMKARVQILAFSQQRVRPLEAEVVTVSADALTTENGQTFYRAELRIPPTELAKLPAGAELTPGMPASVMIRTGRRTVMQYILQPMGDVLNQSLRER